MAIVTGEKREFRKPPQIDTTDASNRAKNAIALAKQKKLEAEQKPDCPEPPLVERFEKPFWRSKEKRWACCTKNKEQWKIWEAEKNEKEGGKWWNWKEWDERFALPVPAGFTKIDPARRKKTMFQTAADAVRSLFR